MPLNKATKKTPARRRLSGRLLRRIIIRTSLGFVFALIVAWGCLTASDLRPQTARQLFDPQRQRDPNNTWSHGLITRGFFAMVVVVFGPEQAEMTPWGSQLPLITDHASAVNVDSLPRWVRREAPTNVPEPMEVRRFSTTACGFPFPMVACVAAEYEPFGHPSLHDYSGIQSKFRCPIRDERDADVLTYYRSNAPLRATWGGIKLRGVTAFPTTTRFGIILPAYLPLTPIWPGLLANTAIYTALIWLTCWLCATTRRAIHRWRHPNANPCKHCRYDLTGIAQPFCPECGHAIPSPQSNPKSERQPPPQTDQ